MSAKFFCDVCSKQLRDDENKRITRTLGKLKIEIMHCWGGAWNGGNVCHGCVLKAVTKGK